MERSHTLLDWKIVIKVTTLPQAIYRFNVIPIKLPMTFFTELEQIALKITWNHDWPRTAKATLKNQNKAWDITAPDFRQYRRATVIKTAWYWHKNGTVDQWNRAESLKTNPHICDQLIFNKGDKNIQWRRNKLFSKRCWENWTAAYKSMKLEHSLILHMRMNSKRLKDLNMRQDTMKLLEKNMGKTFWHKSSQCFLSSVFQGNRNKSKNKQAGLKLISSCTVNESINKMKRQPTDWEEIIANHETDRLTFQNMQILHATQKQ